MDDTKFMLLFTFIAGKNELPALVVEVLEHIQNTCKNGSAYLDILSFKPSGTQLGVLVINSNKVDIREIVPYIQNHVDDSFTYNEWIENPSRPSIVTESDMNTDYIVHMLNIFMYTNIEQCNIDDYGHKANPLGT